MAVFPEGGTSNGTGIIKFKRGVFLSERTVRPVFMKFNGSIVTPDYTMGALPLIIFCLSSYCMKVTVNIMPPFQPNDWLFKNHEKCESHRETTLRWEIFAWAVRDSIIRAGDFSRDFILTR